MQKKISNIVFTKNRPLQLEGYLRSLYKYFPAELIQTYILYKEELFSDEYEQVFKEYCDSKIIREKDFHKDFLKITDEVQTQFILFGIDDVVYFDSVDIGMVKDCFRNNQNIFGFSLRLSRKFLENNGDIIDTQYFGAKEVYKICWPEGKSHAGKYPFELCATVYKTELVKKIIQSTINKGNLAKKLFSPNAPFLETLSKVCNRRKILKKFGYFYNPNTLESWCCRWCQRNNEQVPHYIYFEKQCAAAIQINMVNTSTNNEINECGLTVEKLNEMFKQGYRFNIENLRENKPVETHCGYEHFNISKS